MLRLIRCFIRHEGGATAPEYGLVVAAVAVILIGLAATVGGEVAATFTEPCHQISQQAVC